MKKMTRIGGLHSSVAFSVLMASFATHATAQDLGVEEAYELEAIVIEARRREENLLEVPVSTTVVGSRVLEQDRSHDLEDVARSVAGFEQPSYGDDPRTAQPILRGIGPLSTLLSPDNATTPVIVDGVPRPAFGASGQLLDVDQVEILRGPQGTLFGRNSTAGAIVINSHDPDGVTEGRINVEFGTEGYKQIDLSGGLSLSENVNGRAALRLLGQDGYLENDHPGEDDIGGYGIGAGRAALKFTPGDATEIMVSAGMERDVRDTGYPILLRDSNAYQETPYFEWNQYYGTLNISHQFENFDLYSITGYTQYDIHNKTDNTDGYVFGRLLGVPAAFFTSDGERNESDQDEKQFYHEMRVQSRDDAPFAWVAGVTYSQNAYVEDVTGNSNVFATVNGTRHVELDSKSAAIFGNVSIPFAERFELDAGARFTHERKEIDATFIGNGFPGTVSSYSQNSSQVFNLPTGRVALSYNPTDASMIYGSVSRGAKAGGYPRFTNNASYGQPEEGYDATGVWTYEIGGKAEILNGAGFISAAAFYNDVSDEAIFTYDPVTNTFPIESMDVRSVGFEVETQVELAYGFDLRAGAAYTHAEITGIQDGSAFPDAVGNAVPNVPNWSTMLAVGYETPLDFEGLDGVSLTGLVSWRYVSERPVDPNNSFDLDAQNLIDARLGLKNNNFELYLFGENLLDQQLEQQGSLIAPGVQSVVVSRGRTLGIGLTATF
ncbi:MAG: TonB-dependent receptor [Pseudomonadota bacterium]